MVLAAAVICLLVAAFPHLYAEFTKVQYTIGLPTGAVNLSEEQALPIARQVMDMSGLNLAEWKPRSAPQARLPDVYFHRKTATNGAFYFTNALRRCRIVTVNLNGTNAMCISRYAL